MNRKSVLSHLCKGLRAAGLPKLQTNEILNVITKWYDSSGPEWTVDRIKEIRQWYENTLAGNPISPPWFKHSESGLPSGIWRWLFKQPKGKVLAILSASTAFRLDTHEMCSEAQMAKFTRSLKGNGFTFSSDKQGELLHLLTLHGLVSLPHAGRPSKNPTKEVLKVLRQDSLNAFARSLDYPPQSLPTANDITGKTVPYCDGTASAPKNRLERWDALIRSWNSIPQVTVDFYKKIDKSDWMPYDYTFAYQAPLREPTHYVGRITPKQEGELKCRFFANTHRITQKTLQPLQTLLQSIDAQLKTSYTYDQKDGIRWVQKKLEDGVSLTSSDLSSASDLLDLDASLYIVDKVFRLSERFGDRYRIEIDYFKKVARSDWETDKRLPGVGSLKWCQGQPLGSNPSFPLMAITNQLIGILACAMNNLPLDSCAVIGDDMIIDTRAAETYSNLVKTLFGGELNPTKSLCSNKVAEFAGNIITPNQCLLKKIKYVEPNDDSFMDIMSQLGPCGKHYLRPRQKAVFDQLRYVPGIVFDGPYLKDSFGEPLEKRVSWVLTETQLTETWPVTDQDLKRLKKPVGFNLLECQISGRTVDYIEWQRKLPLLLNVEEEEAYLASLVTSEPKKSGDPRRIDPGRTNLDVLEERVSQIITPYKKYRQSSAESTETQEGCSNTTLLSAEEIKRKMKGECQKHSSSNPSNDIVLFGKNRRQHLRT